MEKIKMMIEKIKAYRERNLRPKNEKPTWLLRLMVGANSMLILFFGYIPIEYGPSTFLHLNSSPEDIFTIAGMYLIVTILACLALTYCLTMIGWSDYQELRKRDFPE